jgi:pyruvate kinase
VFETLAKRGVPSRAEITDASAAQKSECVMLNKGPYITQAIHLLSMILQKMEHFTEKNKSMLPPLQNVMK